jgi:CDGSH-type Zn-finger protein
MSANNVVQLNARGPLYVEGDVEVLDADGNLVRKETGVWLCRCGNSKDKPFCDSSHIAAGFPDDGVFIPKGGEAPEGGGPLRIVPVPNGPLMLKGPVTIYGADGAAGFGGDTCRLCRCGSSLDKPFCDSSHRKIGFTT